MYVQLRCESLCVCVVKMHLQSILANQSQVKVDLGGQSICYSGELKNTLAL